MIFWLSCTAVAALNPKPVQWRAGAPPWGLADLQGGMVRVQVQVRSSGPHLQGEWQSSQCRACPCRCHRARQLAWIRRDGPEHAQGAISASSTPSSKQMRHSPSVAPAPRGCLAGRCVRSEQRARPRRGLEGLRAACAGEWSRRGAGVKGGPEPAALEALGGRRAPASRARAAQVRRKPASRPSRHVGAPISWRMAYAVLPLAARLYTPAGLCGAARLGLARRSWSVCRVPRRAACRSGSAVAAASSDERVCIHRPTKCRRLARRCGTAWRGARRGNGSCSPPALFPEVWGWEG
jgi:hypothetical protein